MNENGDGIIGRRNSNARTTTVKGLWQAGSQRIARNTGSGAQKRPGSIAAAAAIALILGLPAQHAEAKGLSSTAFLQPPDLVAFQGFGGAVAADGNMFAAGTQFAPYVVYVYTNNNGSWTEQARLTSPSGSAMDRFGSSLALEGDTLVVGAGSASTAYVFTNVNGAWLQQAVLVPSGGSGAGFGGSSLNGMSLSGSTLAVAAPAESTEEGNTGSVYVFVDNNGHWTQQQRIISTDPLVGAFGFSVALQNDSLLVGAPFTGSQNVFQPGAAFLFTRQSGVWNEQVRFDPADGLEASLFGEFVSLDNNTVAIGEPSPSEAEIFVNNNGAWSLQTILVGPDDSDFGTSLKVIGDLLMVTAYDDINPDGVQTGDAFIYTRGGSTWTEQPSLYMAPGFNKIPGPGEEKQRFGNFAAMTKKGSQTVFVIGSQLYSNPGAARVGAVYTAILN